MEGNKSNGVPPSSYNHVSHTAEIPIDYYQLLKIKQKRKTPDSLKPNLIIFQQLNIIICQNIMNYNL